MRDVSTAQELFPTSGGIRVPVRTGRMAGADGNLFPQGRLGNRHPAAGFGGRSRRRLSAGEAQEGHQILRKEDQ